MGYNRIKMDCVRIKMEYIGIKTGSRQDHEIRS